MCVVSGKAMDTPKKYPLPKANGDSRSTAFLFMPIPPSTLTHETASVVWSNTSQGALSPMNALLSNQMVTWNSHSSHAGKMVRLICLFHLRNLLAISWRLYPLLSPSPARQTRSRQMACLPSRRGRRVFTPHSPFRRDIVLRPDKKKGLWFGDETETEDGEKTKVPNYAWAKMLAKVFKIDVTQCVSCDCDS